MNEAAPQMNTDALAAPRLALCRVLRERVPEVCPWCRVYDGPCFHCGRCADCGALDRHDDEHAATCFWSGK